MKFSKWEVSQEMVELARKNPPEFVEGDIEGSVGKLTDWLSRLNQQARSYKTVFIDKRKKPWYTQDLKESMNI